MLKLAKTSELQNALEVVEALSPEAQTMLLNIMRQRLQQNRREQLLQEVAEAEVAYAQGNVIRGNVGDILQELNR